jgi:hypothetical protein
MHEIVRLITEAQQGNDISPDRFAKALELDLRELEDYAGVDHHTGRLDPKCESLQEYMRASLLVILTLAKETLDPDRAMFFFKYMPIEGMSHKTPQRLVTEGRAVDVLLWMSL